MDIAFTGADYDKRLGCYVKWLHGNRNQVVEKMYSISAFHFFTESGGFAAPDGYHKYAEYLEQSVLSILSNTAGWHVRIYTDESVLTGHNAESKIWQGVLAKLYQDRIQVVCVRMPRYFNSAHSCHQGLLPVMFRYLPLFDPNVGICLFRDIDNIWTEQHQYFVDKWLAGPEDICLFLNEDYKRQQANGLTADGVTLENKFYNTILSGLWNIRKDIGAAFPCVLWHKIFAYIESYTDFVNGGQYADYKFYGVRFVYGFDELALTRILIPAFINMGLTFYAIPIKIYDKEYFNGFFDEPILVKFFKNMTYDIDVVRSIIINNYWHMDTENAGLSQYMVCILTNIYFNLITKSNKYYKNTTFLNTLRDRVYPVPLLMSIGLFTFQNYKRYNWYDGGSGIVSKFIDQNKKITLAEFTAVSDLSNSGDGQPLPPHYGI